MAMRNSDGIIEGWTRFDNAEKGSAKLSGFLSSILNAMQNWGDNMQTQLPGYRDRVVHVCLKPDEGGMNLNMPPQLIVNLSDRGQAAGQELVNRFATPSSESESECDIFLVFRIFWVTSVPLEWCFHHGFWPCWQWLTEASGLETIPRLTSSLIA
jgi:hypothetical protein